MKKRALLIGLSVVGFSACGAPPSADKTTTAEETTTDIQLARFEVGTNRIEFLENSEGGISVTEETPAGAHEHFVTHSMPHASPLELYLALAPDQAAVPQKLLDVYLEQSGPTLDIDNRTIVDQIETPFVITTENPQLGQQQIEGELASQVSALNDPAPGSCGTNGGNIFRHRYCGRSGVIERCQATHSGGNTVWYDVTVSSGSSRRKNNLTITAACNTTGRVEQRYRNAFGGYSTDESGDIWTVRNNYIKSRLDYGAIRRRRSVNARRQTSSGGVRTVSVFTNANVIPVIVNP